MSSTIDDLYSTDDMYSVQKTRRAAGEGGDGFTERTVPFYQTVDGLLRKTWIGRTRDENWESEVLYLYSIPELRENTDRRVAPPVSNPPFLTSAMIYRGEDTPYGVHVKPPMDLREVPISMVPGVEDGSIAHTFRPGKYNVYQDSGRIKQDTRHYLLVVRRWKDFDPEVAVLACGPQEMERLVTSLAFHLQYRDNLIGVPMRLVKTQSSVDVVIDKELDELDMSDFPTHSPDGSMLLHRHNATVRAEYEKFLLNTGVWTADDVKVSFTDRNGVEHQIDTRHNWRMVTAADQGFLEPDSDATQQVDMREHLNDEVTDEPPFEQAASAKEAVMQVEYDTLTAAELRAMAKDRGLKIRPNDNRKKVIEALRASS